jgi:ribosomal protein S18 acetylase RimI-like enzyme
VTDLIFRDARAEDVPAIVDMYADDELGHTREEPSDPLPPAYWRAFREISGDARNRLVVAEDADEVVGTLQLSFVAHLVLVGTERAQIEAVRVRSDRRSEGIGEAMVRWAIDEARRRGCGLVQLTTNADRTAARRFYERLGFTPSHLGLKLALDPT